MTELESVMSVGKEVSLRKMQVSDVTLKPAPGVDDLFAPVAPMDLMKSAEKHYSRSYNRWVGLTFGGLPVAFTAGFVPAFVSEQAVSTGVMSFGIIGAIGWSVLSLGSMFLPFTKLNTLKYDLFEANLDAFISWLKARYGIEYDPKVDTDTEWVWLFNLVCYGDLGDKDIFKDVNGKQFRLERGPDGIYVVEFVASDYEFVGSGELGSSSFTELSDILVGEAQSLWSAVERKLNVLSGLKLDAVSEHTVARVKQDLVEFSQTVRELNGLESLTPEDDTIRGVLDGLNSDLQRIIDGRAGELKRKLAGQFEWVKSRQLGGVPEKSDIGELFIVKESEILSPVE